MSSEIQSPVHIDNDNPLQLSKARVAIFAGCATAGVIVSTFGGAIIDSIDETSHYYNANQPSVGEAEEVLADAEGILATEQAEFNITYQSIGEICINVLEQYVDGVLVDVPEDSAVRDLHTRSAQECGTEPDIVRTAVYEARTAFGELSDAQESADVAQQTLEDTVNERKVDGGLIGLKVSGLIILASGLGFVAKKLKSSINIWSRNRLLDKMYSKADSKQRRSIERAKDVHRASFNHELGRVRKNEAAFRGAIIRLNLNEARGPDEERYIHGVWANYGEKN